MNSFDYLRFAFMRGVKQGVAGSGRAQTNKRTTGDHEKGLESKTLPDQDRSNLECLWSGGVSNPLSVIEQITYLLFIKRLDDLHTLEEGKAETLGIAMERRVFPEVSTPEGYCSRFPEQKCSTDASKKAPDIGGLLAFRALRLSRVVRWQLGLGAARAAL